MIKEFNQVNKVKKNRCRNNKPRDTLNGIWILERERERERGKKKVRMDLVAPSSVPIYIVDQGENTEETADQLPNQRPLFLCETVCLSFTLLLLDSSLMSIVETLMEPASPGAVQAAKHYYDAQFTEEISNKMRVPEKILPVSPEAFASIKSTIDEPSGVPFDQKNNPSEWMRVPERILVAGGEKHVAGHKQILEAKLESAFLGEDPLPRVSATTAMMTPPRTITLQDHQYPTVDPDDDESYLVASNNLSRGKQVTFDMSALRSSDPLFSPTDALSMSYTGDPTTPSSSGDPNLIAVRKIIRQLSRRVAALERENQSRSLREFLLYSLGFVFFAIKGFTWLTSRSSHPW